MRRDPKQDRGDAELLTAYVDGVSELTIEERKRVDDLLARDPSLREQEGATRTLLHQLRDLPPPMPGRRANDNEPDWNALERSIREAVGDEVPRPWYARMRWRFIVPGVALAMTAAILALVLHDPETQPAPTQPIVKDEPQLPVDDTGTDEDEDFASTPLWLDGTDLEVAIESAEMFDLEWELDEESVPETADLLTPTDLGWVDELDADDLDRAEKFLDRPHRRRSRT